MRTMMISLRRSLGLATLLGAGLVGLRWAAMAVTHAEPIGNGIAAAASTQTAKPGVWAGAARIGAGVSGFNFTPPDGAGAGVEATPPADATPADETPSPAESAPAVEAPPAQKPSESQIRLTQEISLQETLDRLGYTVNVPTVYDGHTLHRWNNYRISSADNSISAERFHGNGATTFSMLGQQAMCAPNTVFGCVDASGRVTPLFRPDPGSSGMWLNATTPRCASVRLRDSVRFFIEDTAHTMNMGTLFSTAQNNVDRTSHLLVLPALMGGTWVDVGNNMGHWQGGKSRGYLLCWEDWNDFDYQDIVILAEQLEPEWPDSVAKI